MKTILLIGLGRFGRHAAMKLDELHHEVMAVDKDEERVRAVLPYVTNAQIGDGTQEEFLSSLGVNNFDVWQYRPSLVRRGNLALWNSLPEQQMPVRDMAFLHWAL